MGHNLFQNPDLLALILTFDGFLRKQSLICILETGCFLRTHLLANTNSKKEKNTRLSKDRN